jgi:hypothetical protein
MPFLAGLSGPDFAVTLKECQEILKVPPHLLSGWKPRGGYGFEGNGAHVDVAYLSSHSLNPHEVEPVNKIIGDILSRYPAFTYKVMAVRIVPNSIKLILESPQLEQIKKSLITQLSPLLPSATTKPRVIVIGRPHITLYEGIHFLLDEHVKTELCELFLGKTYQLTELVLRDNNLPMSFRTVKSYRLLPEANAVLQPATILAFPSPAALPFADAEVKIAASSSPPPPPSANVSPTAAAPLPLPIGLNMSFSGHMNPPSTNTSFSHPGAGKGINLPPRPPHPIEPPPSATPISLSTSASFSLGYVNNIAQPDASPVPENPPSSALPDARRSGKKKKGTVGKKDR